MSDFPSELVEAAAKALMVSKGGDCYVEGVGSCGGTHTDCYYRGMAGDVLAAVVPRIEQRVIDRLAREADGRVQRFRDAIHAADRELITIADFSVQEAADAIDSVRAGLKDALAETDAGAQRDELSVPDQFQAIDGVIDRLAAEAGGKRARTSQLHRIVTLDVAIEAVREGAACGVAAERARVSEALAEPPYPHPANSDLERARNIGWEDARSAALAPERTGEGT